MTFLSHHTTLQLAMSAALAARHTAALRHLLDSHGSFAFALALASHPGRQMADILSMLVPAESADVHRRLSHDDRARLTQAGMVSPSEPACVRQQQRLPQARISTSGRFGNTHQSAHAFPSRLSGATR